MRVTQASNEVSEQAARLGSHPSIVIWGGNNEVEASLAWYPATRSNMTAYREDYQALFLNHVKSALLKVWADLLV